MALIDRIVKNINEIRDKKGITIDKLCKDANIPMTTLAKIRSKQVADPRSSTLVAIAKALKCKLDDLVK